MRYLLFQIALVVACTVMWAEAVAQPARQDRLDEASLTAAASNLWETISQAVSQVGGDLERQHLHLVLAFSTGHFNKDPMAAQAAKQVAWHVVREYLIAGDRVSCYAWEMDLWEHLPPGQQYTVTLTDSSDEGKKFIQDLFPQTVQDGSLGGHDTERAIVQIVRRLGDARDAVTVLLTNDAQSVAPRGMQTIGTDNPAYRQVLQNWTRLPQVSKSGASLVLPYKVFRADGVTLGRRLDVVLVVPNRFATPNGAVTRTPSPAGNGAYDVRKLNTLTPKSAKSRPFLIFGAAAIALLLAVFVVVKSIKKWGTTPMGTKRLVINGQMVDTEKVDSNLICYIGAEYHDGKYNSTVIREQAKTARVIAEVWRRGKGFILKPIDAIIHSVNGELRLSKEPIDLSQDKPVSIIIQFKDATGGPLLPNDVKITVDWQEEFRQAVDQSKSDGGGS
jgi:hypothetical protein